MITLLFQGLSAPLTALVSHAHLQRTAITFRGRETRRTLNSSAITAWGSLTSELQQDGSMRKSESDWASKEQIVQSYFIDDIAGVCQQHFQVHTVCRMFILTMRLDCHNQIEKQSYRY